MNSPFLSENTSESDLQAKLNKPQPSLSNYKCLFICFIIQSLIIGIISIYHHNKVQTLSLQLEEHQNHIQQLYKLAGNNFFQSKFENSGPAQDNCSCLVEISQLNSSIQTLSNQTTNTEELVATNLLKVNTEIMAISNNQSLLTNRISDLNSNVTSELSSLSNNFTNVVSSIDNEITIIQSNITSLSNQINIGQLTYINSASTTNFQCWGDYYPFPVATVNFNPIQSNGYAVCTASLYMNVPSDATTFGFSINGNSGMVVDVTCKDLSSCYATYFGVMSISTSQQSISLQIYDVIGGNNVCFNNYSSFICYLFG